jgi:hypothetical protein
MELAKFFTERRRRIRGGILATVGYLLSPLSWWNDLFINIPLAYAFAYLVGLISQDLFYPALVVGYWLTNIAGFILLHKGLVDVAAAGGEKKRYTVRDFAKDLAISVAYTMIIVALIYSGILRYPTEYFG